MPRIVYSPSTVGGKQIARAIAQVSEARQSIDIVKAMMDQITNGGVNPENLEASVDFNAGTGAGADLYNAIVNMKSYLSDVTTTSIAELFQGD